MSDLEQTISPASDSSHFASTKHGVLMPSLRLFINLLTNICIVVTALACFLYSCKSVRLSLFELHIVLCVLGYQLFMCQGILVLSDYNSWTLYFGRLRRRKIHIGLQLTGIIFVIVGSAIIIKQKRSNFNTYHGIFGIQKVFQFVYLCPVPLQGLCALILTLISLINGLLASYVSKLRRCCSVFWIKYIHYITGVATLFCAAISLCYGFEKFSFRKWVNNDNGITILMVMTGLFTVSVSFEFWIYTASRVRHLL